MSWTKTSHDTDSQAIYEAKSNLRKAARTVANCEYCSEGWHDTGKGFVRCQCWSQYENAHGILENLDPKFFAADEYYNLKPDNPGPWVELSQITEMRKSMERMGVRG